VLHEAAGAKRWQLPATHTSLFAHVLPQSPQLSGSVWKSTHETILFLVQSSGVGAWQPPEDAVHLPARHISPCAQAVLQSPQKRPSEFVSTQLPLHVVRPGRHAQAPAMHAWAFLQAVPHFPQFLGSVFMSTQLPLHVVRPALQVHAPAAHADSNVASQAFPQVPQWSKLVFRSTHVPLHEVCPAVGHSQMPALQV
jgi:hypothetical protein